MNRIVSKSVVFITLFLSGTTVCAQSPADDLMKEINKAMSDNKCGLALSFYIDWKIFPDIDSNTEKSIEAAIRECYVRNINATLDRGNCDDAERDYNSLKEFAGQYSNIETRIRNCRAGSQQPTSTSSRPSAPIRQPTPPSAHLQVGSGNRVFADGMKLKRNQVRDIMANTDALQAYNKGISKSRNGTICLISGICLSASGGLILAMQPFDRRDIYIGEDGNEYYHYRNEKFNDWLGGGSVAVGVIMAATGIVLKATSKKHIKEAVNSYNGERNRSSVEWELDFTGNRLRLALSF